MKMLYRVLFYILGIFLIAMGVNVALNSNLGVSPVNSLPVAISVVSGIEKGICVTVIFLLYVLVQFLLLRRDFKMKNLLQIVFSTMFGYFVTLTSSLLAGFRIPTYFGQLAMLLISIVVIALGLVFYLTADIVPMPMEGMALAVTQKLKKFKFHNVKVALDCLSVLLAVVVLLVGSLVLERPIEWIVREGTVVSALAVGKVMGFISKFLKPRLQAICFGPAEETAAT